MTLEMTVGRSGTTYRVNPNDPSQLDSRENRHGARWVPCGKYSSAEKARAALLAIRALGPEGAEVQQ